jgi:hypothetical protein
MRFAHSVISENCAVLYPFDLIPFLGFQPFLDVILQNVGFTLCSTSKNKETPENTLNTAFSRVGAFIFLSADRRFPRALPHNLYIK